MAEPAVITCALTGVLTNPAQHPVPVTAAEMAAEARRAFDAGATVVHLHFRDQRPGLGHMPTWDTDVCGEIVDAIRAEVPELLINSSTGVMGTDISGPEGCLRRIRPEIAAMNSGTLNYLKARRSKPTWAWPPMVFDNPVSKITAFLELMYELDIVPECECFDTGIVRSLAMFKHVGLLKEPVHASLVMGVASGMPAKKEWLPLLLDELPEGADWQAIVIGRDEVWDVHQATAELGGHLRTGLEDTFYLPNGERADSNGPLIEALATCARQAGRTVATPAQAREIMGVKRPATV